MSPASTKRPASRCQIAHLGIILVGADDGDVFLAPLDAHPVEVVHDAGGGHDARAQLIAHGLHVGDLDVIGVGDGHGGVIAAVELRVNHVRPDGLDLIQHVVAAGEGNGDDQDHRGVADHQAQGGQKRAEFIGAEAPGRWTQRFDVEHQLPGLG